jgi:2-isopropylmalate synthase
MTRTEKLEIAEQLARLGVDIIEAGFPVASQGDFDAVEAIAKSVKGPVIAALARAVKEDIDKAWTAIQPAAKKRIHTFINASDIQIEYQLRSTREAVLAKARELVRHARSLCEDVEFSPMDATRADVPFMFKLLAAAIEEGATTLNIPDTVGYTTPEEYATLIRDIREQVPGADRCIISVHCHDDLGMAVANSLAGVRAGARQIECTINGIGERAGNASLEEVVMALHTRREFFGVGTHINTREIARSSRLLSTTIGLPVPPNKAVVGANAFAHESGIHQDGVLKNRMTYEIMSAETVGLDGNALILGKHSGRHAFRTKLVAMGYEFESEEEFQHLFERFKDLCDRKKHVDDRDIEALVTSEAQHTPAIFKLEHVQVTSGTGVTPVATVTLRDPHGELMTDSAHGTGPVDAIYKAINRVIQRPNELIEFAINAITEGLDAVAEVTVRIRDTRADEQPRNGQASIFGQRRDPVFNGYGVNTDTLVAAAEAYMGALNKMLAARQQRIRAEEAAYAAGYDKNSPSYAVDTFGGK